MSIGWIVFLCLIAAALQSALFSACNLRALSYRREFDRTTATEGERATLIETLRNTKILPVPWLRVESRISPNLVFKGDDAEREISAERYHKSVFFLPPFCQVVRRHEVLCQKRGHYQLNSVSITAGDILGIAAGSEQLDQNCSLTVWPRLLTDDELGSLSSRWQGALAVKRWIAPDPFLVAGIRDYISGDPLRDIHWRQSARVGTPQVKVRDHTADPRVLVVLNVQTAESQWGELMEHEQQIIEHGIRVAATLCTMALRAGTDAGFASNGCLVGEKGKGLAAFVPARRYASQETLLLSTMARLEIHRELSFPTFLQSLSNLRGEDIVILSAYRSEAIDNCIRQFERHGNTATLVLLKGDGHDA